jgi:hypothetical protein
VPIEIKNGLFRILDLAKILVRIAFKNGMVRILKSIKILVRLSFIHSMYRVYSTCNSCANIKNMQYLCQVSKLLNLLKILFNAITGSWSCANPTITIDQPPTQNQPISPTKGLIMKISTETVLMGRIKPEELSSDKAKNLATLLMRVNALLQHYKGPIKVNSGYRSPSINAAIGGAAKSWHQECAAIDLSDADGQLWAYCLANLELCAELGLWLEDKRWTPTWVHLQIYPPKSGKRVFAPKAGPAPAPKAWTGHYDSKQDSVVGTKNDDK